MPSCPRCGAANGAGRSSCWSCWAALAGTPVDDHDAPSPAHTSGHADDVPPMTMVSATREDEMGFAFVAAPVLVPESPAPPRGPSRAVNGIVFCFILAIVVVVGWYYTRHARPQIADAPEIAQTYLTAITIGDTGAQQQLSTAASKATLVPSWFTIVAGSVNGAGVVDGTGAMTVPAQLQLSPTAGDDQCNEALISALSRDYQIDIVLERGGTGWRVDQQATFNNMRTVLTANNPDVSFPAWE